MKFFWISLVSFVIIIFAFKRSHSFNYADPSKPHRTKKGFVNNYAHDPQPSFWKWQWERLTRTATAPSDYTPDVVPIDYALLGKGQNTYTWIGHATSLIQLKGLNVLTDPVFSNRASPFAFAGPKRLGPLPLSIDQLPRIDVVVISHNHYDHLDRSSVLKIYQRFGDHTQFLVPLGLRSFLRDLGIKNVLELDWWDQKTVQQNGQSFRFTFTPSQHWSSRWIWDRNQTLWGGWFIENGYKILFAGDTGYSKDFQDIRKRLGVPDFAMIPIGAYGPRWFMKNHHVDVADAIQIHKDLGSKKSVAIHWGTFKLSDEPLEEPAKELKRLSIEKSLNIEEFTTTRQGQTILLN